MEQRERIYRTHALVLRRRDQGEADRVITLYTPGMGKLEVIGKGVRKTTSHKAGHLELFTHSSLLIAKGRTWDIVTEVTTIESFRNLREDLDAIGRASYVCELLDCFADSDDGNLPLWEIVLFALRTLDEAIAHKSQIDASAFLRWFELHLLSITGFQPQLFNCLGCGEPLTPVVNYLSLVAGGVFCPTCNQNRGDVETLEPDVLKILRFYQSRPWLEVSTVTVRPVVLRRVENVLYRYLLHVLERRLKSTDFLRRLQFLSTSN